MVPWGGCITTDQMFSIFLANIATYRVRKLKASPKCCCFVLPLKDKCTFPPRRALRRGLSLSRRQLNGFLIKGELVRLNCNLMQIWSRNDSQWIIDEDKAAEQKLCNSYRDSLMFSFTPDKSERRGWIYGLGKFRRNPPAPQTK